MNIIKDPKKPEGTKQYRATFTVKGKRKKRWFASRAEAEKFVTDRENELSTYGASIADLSSEQRMDLSRIAKLSREMDCSLFDVLQILKEKDTDSALKDDVPVSELYWDFRDSLVKKGLREKSIECLLYAVQGFYGYQDVKVRDVTDQFVLEYLNHNGWGNNTKRLRRNQLHQFFAWVKREDYRRDNPVAKINCKEEFGAYQGKEDVAVFFPDDVRKLFEVCRKHDPELLPYFALGIFCGVRPNEIASVHWRHEFPAKQWKNLPSYVCLEANAVYISRGGSKTREKREVPLQDNAKAWLELGGDLPAMRNIRRRRDRIKYISGVTWGKDESDIMRHTFASCHLKHFRHETDLKTAMGHSINTTTLFTHYIGSAITPPMAKDFWNIFP